MKIHKNILISLFVFIALEVSAFERADMYKSTLRILQLSHNQGDYSSYSKMMELYQDMRSKIKSDLELGNINTPVDYELLTEGLVFENYQALQSVLGFNNYNDTAKEFSDEIDRTYEQKISYALKQNKIAFQTDFEVKKTEEQTECKIILNGKELKELSFIGPSGVPFYIGIYCADTTFEVKKIQAGESQKLYTISFTNLKPIIYRADPVEMGVPNPYPNQKVTEKINPTVKRLDLYGRKKMLIATGAGIEWYASYNGNDYYHFSPATDALLLYSSTQFVYKNFEFVADLGPVTRTTRNSSGKIVTEEDTIFFRPILSFTEQVYRYKDIFYVNASLGLSSFFVGSEKSFLSLAAYGLKVGAEGRVYLYGPLFLGGDLGLTYYMLGPTSNTVLVGTVLRLGIDL